jgi:putative membrane protein
MRALWMLVKFLLVLAIVIVGAMFAMENNQLVDVDFILLQSATMSLGLWLMIFLAVGCLLGLLASSVLITYYRRQLNRAHKKD